MIARCVPAALAVCVLPAAATTLTFDIDGVANGNLVSQNYGDQVMAETEGTFGYLLDGGATPNIEVSYAGDGGNDLSYWTTGYSDLSEVIYNEEDFATGFEITLTADPGWLVDLRGFDIGNFGSEVSIGVSIEDGTGGVIDSTAGLTLPGSTEPHISYNPASPAIASTIVIRIDTTGYGGASDNVGLDNITFTPVLIPAPGSLALAGIAGVSLLRRRR